jgi:hypothetical protein
MNKIFLLLTRAACLAALCLLCVAGCDRFSPLDSGNSGNEEEENSVYTTGGKDKPQMPEDTKDTDNTKGTEDTQSATEPQKLVWYVSSTGDNSNSGTGPAAQLASVQAALTKIKSAYNSGKWPAGESAVIIISGRITASGSLGSNESMVEITGAGSYPPIILEGAPAFGGILDANRKKGEDGRVLFITNNKVTLGKNLTLTGGNQLWGGAVCIGTNGFESEGEFIMAGGEISGNTGASGGAVMIYKGSMVMTGGAIRQNNNNYSNNPGGGGAIYVSEYTTFTMTGGIIAENGEAKTEKGGGIFIDGRGIANIENGEIIKNTSTVQGGGVYIAPYGTCNMSGGLVAGNVSKEGGGVYTLSTMGGKFNKTGGTIGQNTPD